MRFCVDTTHDDSKKNKRCCYCLCAACVVVVVYVVVVVVVFSFAEKKRGVKTFTTPLSDSSCTPQTLNMCEVFRVFHERGARFCHAVNSPDHHNNKR